MRTRRVVGWSGEVLVTLGVLLLLFAAWQLWWTDVVSDRAQTRIVQTLEDDFAHGAPGPVSDDGIPAAIGTDGAFAAAVFAAGDRLAAGGFAALTSLFLVVFVERILNFLIHLAGSHLHLAQPAGAHAAGVLDADAEFL